MSWGPGFQEISSGIKNKQTRCSLNPSVFLNPSNLALLSDPGATAGLGFIVSDMISGQVRTKENMTCGFSNFTQGPTGDPGYASTPLISGNQAKCKRCWKERIQHPGAIAVPWISFQLMRANAPILLEEFHQ